MAPPVSSFFMPAGSPGAAAAQPRAAVFPGSSAPWLAAAPLAPGASSTAGPAATAGHAPPAAGSSISQPAGLGSQARAPPPAGPSSSQPAGLGSRPVGPPPGFQRWDGQAATAPIPPVRLTYSRRHHLHLLHLLHHHRLLLLFAFHLGRFPSSLWSISMP